MANNTVSNGRGATSSRGNGAIRFREKVEILPHGTRLQLVTGIRLYDLAIVRSNSPEEVLEYPYERLGKRLIIPWRKVKGKLRRLVAEKGRSLGIGEDCHLKESLCLECPTCWLFGAVGAVTGKKKDYNLLSRVLGETFISTTSKERSGEGVTVYTANAVDEKTHMVGQSLMTTVGVSPEMEFLGVVTITDPTEEMASIVIRGLERISRIGASSNQWGRCKTTVLGALFSDQEEVSAYELLQLSEEELEGKMEEMRRCLDEILQSLPEEEKAFNELDKEIKALLDEEGMGEKKKKGKRGEGEEEEEEEG